MTVRTRIAPSPTGPAHVGTAYVAIFNLALARSAGGQFLLRIEDTDQTRSETRWEDMIYESLHWLGLKWDEGPDAGGPVGPYRQSERSELYARHAQDLVASGRAYCCFCSKERLDAVRDAQKAAKADTIMYDRHCRNLPADEVKRRLEAGESHVIRLAIPLEGETTLQDAIRGTITIANATIDDQVLIKADGFPTYHLANVVDDHAMGITHVLRAEEWITSTPKHLLLYEAFGWQPPVFAHVPLLRNKDRTKISKRKNPVSLPWYRDEGYLPEAVVNFLALMGYSMPDGNEVFTFEQMCENFSIERINTGGPVFDLEKLAWLNGVYIRALAPDELVKRLLAFGVSRPEGQVRAIIPLLQERMRTLKDFETMADYFFAEPAFAEPALLVPKKKDAAGTAQLLAAFADRMASLAPSSWTKDELEAAMRTFTEELGWSTRDAFMAVRVAITGRTATPPLVESLVILGQDATVARLRKGAEALHSLVA